MISHRADIFPYSWLADFFGKIFCWRVERFLYVPLLLLKKFCPSHNSRLLFCSIVNLRDRGGSEWGPLGGDQQQSESAVVLRNIYCGIGLIFGKRMMRGPRRVHPLFRGSDLNSLVYFWTRTSVLR